MRYRILYPFILSCVIFSCQREQILNTEPKDSDFIEVPAALLVTPAESGTDTDGAPTKAVIDPVTPIRNLWVVQYQGTDDKAVVIGKPQYIPEYDAGSTTLRLLPTPEQCKVVIIANTFNETLSFYQGSTLAALKDKINDHITSPADVLGHDASIASADARFPDDNSYYPILCGVSTVLPGVDATTEVSVQLKRNVAKIVINVTNNSGESSTPVTIRSVRLMSVPDRSLYITNYENTSTMFPTIFPEALSMGTINYPAVEWDSSNPSLTQTFTFYSPVNKRGQTSNNDQKTKSHKPPVNSTYFVISGSYKEGDKTIPITFRFYAGANLVNDFNLEANKVYTYNINITGITDAETDDRVESWPDVDFSTWPDANCYIINPSDANDVWRKFRIPVRRVNTFWGDVQGSNGYEHVQDCYLYSTTAWYVEVICADFVLNSENFRISKTEGQGLDATTDGFFEVEVPSDTRGNVLIGIKRKDNPELGYLWSWHLWITDYDPYPSTELNKVEGQYSYPVVNGKVHRYEGDVWNTGIYRDAFIMDRNLGRLSEYSSGKGQGALYYQFGRKDPFMGLQCYDVNGKNIASYKAIGESYPTPVINETKPFNNMPYSVHNPTHYIVIRCKAKELSYNSSFYFTFQDKYNPIEFDASTIWHDPNTSIGGIHEGGKSLFDPCPPGWSIPSENIWADFRTNIVARPTTNVNGYSNRSFKPYDLVGGAMYWPYVESYSGYDISDFVFFPITSYRSGYDGGSINANHSGAELYTSRQVINKVSYTYSILTNTNNKVWRGSALFFGSTTISYHASYTVGTGNTDNAVAFSVRCISNKELNEQ